MKKLLFLLYLLMPLLAHAQDNLVGLNATETLELLNKIKNIKTIEEHNELVKVYANKITDELKEALIEKISLNAELRYNKNIRYSLRVLLGTSMGASLGYEVYNREELSASSKEHAVLGTFFLMYLLMEGYYYFKNKSLEKKIMLIDEKLPRLNHSLPVQK